MQFSSPARSPRFTVSLGSLSRVSLRSTLHLSVSRFPGQEHVAGNSKIPTLLYYDRYGSMVAAGAEADSASIEAQAEDEGWIKAELYVSRSLSELLMLIGSGSS